MPTVTLSHGTVDYRVAGPPDAARPVVFVHGFLVDGALWAGTAAALARHGVRSYAPTWPLGSHTIAMAADADQSPRGVARTVIEFLEALDLEDVTLVGNDSGGAISQFVVDTDASRVGRLVLTNCDAFDQFPPAPFDRLFRLLRTPRRVRLALAPMRLRVVRHSALGFGMLVDRPLPADVTARWVAPCLDDPDVRRDTVAFLRAVDPGELVDVASRLSGFAKPVLLVWGSADRFFRVDLARRLVEVFPDARLVEIAGGRTFLPLDEPQRVADEIVAAGFGASAPVAEAAARD